ncbi:MAG: hypothetical protein EZS28_047054 [Streblomastix strix]|uniref:Uncharacterized protein n=1 Tax=Streblomastix strix TaxID=222440 RepID=A0A5J4TH10_9EUKA|nr:MAG: hypothetical protein EZS28_047054 [Streblomastix strix]
MDVELYIVKENIQQLNKASNNVHIQHYYVQIHSKKVKQDYQHDKHLKLQQLFRFSFSQLSSPAPTLAFDPIGTAVLRFIALINKFFPYFASFPVKQLALVKSYLVSPPVYITRYMAPPSPEAVGTVQLVNVDAVPVINILPDALFNVPLITLPFPFVIVFEMLVNVHPSILRFPEEEYDINDPPLSVIPLAENQFNVVVPELICIIFPLSIVTVVIYPLVNNNVPPSCLIILPPLFVKLSILESVILTLPKLTYTSPLEIDIVVSL